MTDSAWSFFPNMIKMSTDVLIRELDPRDLPGVAAVHLMAFPKSALTMLGAEAVRRYYEWQLLGPHEASVLSACINSELVGFCFGGVFRGAMSGFVRKNRSFLITQVIARPWLVTNPIFRERLTMGIRGLRNYAKPMNSAPVSAPPLNNFGILAIAVDPQRQGLGIGKLLMKATEDVARQRGFHEINLSVNPRNQQAVQFYERLNWKRFSKENVWKGQMKKSLASG